MRKLSVNDLRWQCKEDEFSFRTTAEVKPLGGILGQKEAFQALRTGIEIRKSGYNVFVSGPHASGRITLIKECLRRFMPNLPPQPDLVYVNNFYTPYKPRLLQFPSGVGNDFVNSLDSLLSTVHEKVKDLTNNSNSQKKLKRFKKDFEESYNQIRSKFEKRVKHLGFFVGQTRSRDGQKPDLFYLFESRPISMEELEEKVFEGHFPADKFSGIRKNYEKEKKKLGIALSEITRLNQKYVKDVGVFERNTIKVILEKEIKELKKEFFYPKVSEHFDELKEEILNQLKLFRPTNQDLNESEGKDPFRSFRANLITTGMKSKRPPVVFENNPTFSNLFGFIERSSGDDGSGPCDFMDIRPGSLIEANNGFLILDISFVIQSSSLWNAFKTIVRTGKVTVREPEGPSNPLTGLKPESVPIDIKVILVGEPQVFDLLYDIDPEFRHNFKVCVMLEPDFPLTKKLLRKQLPAFISKICKNENLYPLNKKAVCEVAEYGIKLSGHRKKFTGSLGKLADLLREADWCAKCEKRHTIDRRHVKAALKQSIMRINSAERRLNEAIVNGTVMIQTKGMKVGQINGLAVYDLGDYSFGRPAKITTEISVGKTGIINIERESGMSGYSHDKGVHILSGYLRSLFAQKRPLSLSASICFEQSYSTIDGDSASSTEMYSLLSSLSNLPIRQDIAVTGSVNQKGEVQSIGCVNEKIEGFFDVISTMQPTGKEGVIIPHGNLQELMLREDVVEAVKKGQFRIWAVKTIKEGIEILTTVKAGTLRKDNTWTPGSVFDRVDKRLDQLVHNLVKYNVFV